MKQILLIITLLLTSLSLHAQLGPYDQMKVEYDSLRKEKKYEEALVIAKQMSAWALANETDTSLNYAVSFRHMGTCFYHLKELDSTKKYLQLSMHALKVQNRKNHLDYFINLSKLGSMYWAMHDYKVAETYYKQSLENFKKVIGEEHPDYASILAKLGSLYWYMGDYKAAENYYKRATEIRKKVLGEEHPDYAGTLDYLGTLYKLMGDYKAAETYYKQALVIRKKVLGEQHPDYASTLNNLGVAYFNLGDYKAAEVYYKQSAEIRKKVLGEEHPDYASTLNNLGNFYSNMGDYNSAEPLYKKALEIHVQSLGEEHPHYTSILNNLGLCYFNMGDYKRAEPLLKVSLEIDKKALGEGHPDYASSLNNLGLLYSNMGDYKAAEPYIKQSLEIDKKVLGEEHPDYAIALSNLGLLYFNMGDYKEAEPYIKQSLEIRKKVLYEEHPEYSNSLNSLGDLYLQMGDYSSAEHYYKQTFEIKLGLLKTNFSWLSNNEKQAYWKKESVFYEKLSWFASTSYSKVPSATELSYNCNLVSKSLLLVTSRELDQALAASTDYSLKENYQKLKLRRKNYSKLVSEGSGNKAQIERLNREADSLDKILVNSLGEYAKQKRNLLITWERVQENLDQGEAAIEFVRFMKDSAYHYQALIIRKDFALPLLAPLCDENKLAKLEPRIDFGEYYPLVWKPIEKHLKGIHTIYYAPVGELYNVPFHSFSVPREKEGQRYLMDKYTLHQLISTRYLAMGLKDKQKERIAPSISIVGGVNYDYLPGSSNDVLINSNLANTRDLGSASLKVRFLPGTVKEAKAIESVLSKNRWETTYLQGGNAKEERLTEFSHNNAKGIMHIATHGYAFPEYSSMDTAINKKSIRYSYRYSNNPMVRSGLVLAGGNWALMGSDTLTQLGAPENGVLTALEVSQLNLRNTKLVVLSACETGLGQIEGSEGTFGLKRGFKLAGVEQMIVSLWSVPDKETKELMTIFYTDLAQTLDPVSSFQYAQNQMRDKYPIYPEKWAGFVLVR